MDQGLLGRACNGARIVEEALGEQLRSVFMTALPGSACEGSRLVEGVLSERLPEGQGGVSTRDLPGSSYGGAWRIDMAV